MGGGRRTDFSSPRLGPPAFGLPWGCQPGPRPHTRRRTASSPLILALLTSAAQPRGGGPGRLPPSRRAPALPPGPRRSPSPPRSPQSHRGPPTPRPCGEQLWHGSCCRHGHPHHEELGPPAGRKRRGRAGRALDRTPGPERPGIGTVGPRLPPGPPSSGCRTEAAPAGPLAQLPLGGDGQGSQLLRAIVSTTCSSLLRSRCRRACSSFSRAVRISSLYLVM